MGPVRERTSGREVFVTTDGMQMSELAGRVRQALESADLESFMELLDPDVQWGPPEGSSADCHNRDEVVAWWQQGRGRG
jgi:hypothetical protein